MTKDNTDFKTRIYSLGHKELFEQFQSEITGLHKQHISSALEKYGYNELISAPKKSTIRIFADQFKDLLVAILIVAAIISGLSGHAESTAVIIAVIVLNAVLGTVQTLKAEQSLESLKKMSSPHAKVMRDGSVIEIAARELVPGDILVLEAGDMVAADSRIIQNYSLQVNESALTGESIAVEKSHDTLPDKDIMLADQVNMVFSGGLVTSGRATALVVATGMNTEMGKIASLMNQTQSRKTPLQISLDDFSKKLAIGVIAICGLVFLLSIFRSGMDILDSLMFAVALAVAAIPEALGSIVTIVLAIGTQKMAKENAIIKELKAVESLGSVSIICSDKTGTLTQNKMTVQKIYVAGNLHSFDDINLKSATHEKLVRIAILASDAITDEKNGTAVGDPTEIALVEIGDALGIDEVQYRSDNPRLQELPFDSTRKLMSTLHAKKEGFVLNTKGALDVILQRSKYVFSEDGFVVATSERIKDIERVAEELSGEGLRVLAFATKDMSKDEIYDRKLHFDDECDYIFVGLIAMMDPARHESVAAVADAKRGGIKTVMITGDHVVTAKAIARQIGIFEEGDLAVNGLELDKMNNQEFSEVLPKISVYARVSPEHKIRIVEAWQNRGNIVAMTGDGVNDAPALKKADIGVAMGITGTEVSKDAASMILTDDNFSTIVRAIINGRSVYANIKNTVNFLLSGNAAGIICVLLASLAGLPAPFAAVHLLFINLITDSLPAIAIGMEPSRRGLLNEKPRNPKDPLLNRALSFMILRQGLLIAAATMAAYIIGLMQNDVSLAMTMAFATLSLARLFHGFNCRSNESIFKLGFLTNKYSILAFLLGSLLLTCVLFIPALQQIMSVSPNFNLSNFAIVSLLAVAPSVFIQVGRLIAKAIKK